MRVAAIDVGTNTTLLLIAEAGTPPRALLERAEITRLGRGIGGDGRLRADNVTRTLEVLREYAALAQEHGAQVYAVGTEALRRAPNAREFLEPARALLGSAVAVIDGEREAALSFLAARRSFPELASQRMAVVDIGGGSTEFILAEGDTLVHRESLPLGSVRLTEAHVKHDPARPEEIAALRAAIQAPLDRVPLAAFAARAGGLALVGTAGTVTSLAAMAQDLASYDPARVHGYRLTGAALTATVERLARSKQSEREAMAGLDPRRADVILAGAVLLKEITTRAGGADVVVSDRGVRWGLALEALEAGR